VSADREQNHLDFQTDMIDNHYSPGQYASGMHEPQDPEEPLDMLHMALSNTYQAYMRGMFRKEKVE
jgi:hypothetical protein